MSEKPADPTPFGAELKRRRLEAGLTLLEMEHRAFYSRSHLSKVENGRKPPNRELARRCDSVLNAGGALAALVAAEPGAEADANTEPAQGDVWVLTLGPDGRQEFGRQVDLGGGRSSGTTVTSWALAPVNSAGFDGLPGDGGLEPFSRIFNELRALGQTLSPVELAPGLIAHTNSLRIRARRSRRPKPLLLLASRFAEYTGWMAQEKGDDKAALWWTDHAVELASAGDDTEMLAYAHVRRALIALYRHDPVATIGLAQRVREISCRDRILGLAAQREAQGHAIAGDYDECQRSLDHARERMAAAGSPSTQPSPFGPSTVADQVTMTAGWCLHDLGRSAEAASLIAPELARIPPQALRARARYGARLALALASTKEIEQACAVVGPYLAAMPFLDSATIRSDLTHLARTLNRWHKDPTVRAIMPRLSTALRTYAA